MLDSTGFKRKRFDDLFAEMEAKAREAFGETVNTAARSPLGIILRLFAWFLAPLWSTAEDVYNSGYKNTASGANLDRLAPQTGLSRILDRWATGMVTLTGTAGYEVPAGFRVAASGAAYETLDAVTLTGGTGTVAIRALDPGADGNAASGAVTIIVNPTPDVTAVTNPLPITGGRAKETDAELRQRMDNAVAGGGAASVDALRGALLRMEDVRAASVIENTGMNTDSAGRPPKSFQAYVLGGEDQAIAETIFATKSGGVEAYGNITRQVADLGGQLHTVRFSRAEQVRMYIEADVRRNDQYPADGDAQIKRAMIRYIGGEDAAGSYYNGLNMGSPVVYTKLISAVYSVPGVEDVDLLVGPAGGIAGENVLLEPYQIAQVREQDIEVTSHV